MPLVVAILVLMIEAFIAMVGVLSIAAFVALVAVGCLVRLLLRLALRGGE